MKSIVVFLRHVITPLVLCLFLVLGLTAAMLSGIVEYSVIKELFSGNDAKGYSVYIPLIIVIVLEGLKLFLHYIIPAHKKLGDTGRHLIAKNVTKYFLVAFSLLCTIIYVSNSLYTPETIKSSTEAMKEEIETKYQTVLTDGIDIIKNDANDRIESEKNKVEHIRAQLQQLTPVYRPRTAYENYIQEKLRLESELKKAEDKYNSEYNLIITEMDAKISKLRDNNLNEMQKEIDAISQSFNYVSAGDNKYLSSALIFIVSVLGYSEYDRLTYYLCVCVIALIVSVALELAIVFAQSYLALNGDQLVRLFSDTELIPESLKERANRMVKLVVQASIMLSVYLIYQAISETMITSAGILSAFVSYLISIILTSERFRLSLNVGNLKEYDNKASNTIVKAKDFALPVIIQTLICIVGFLLLSVYMGYALADLIPTTIALSVGSISGQVILRPKSI